MLTCICATCSPSHGTGDQRAGDRQADTVGVALVETETGGLHRAAKHVEREHGARQQQAVAVHALEFGDGYALAARNAHLVGEQQVDEAHLRVLVRATQRPARNPRTAA